jgi:hypothetical protein
MMFSGKVLAVIADSSSLPRRGGKHLRLAAIQFPVSGPDRELIQIVWRIRITAAFLQARIVPALLAKPSGCVIAYGENASDR